MSIEGKGGVGSNMLQNKVRFGITALFFATLGFVSALIAWDERQPVPRPSERPGLNIPTDFYSSLRQKPDDWYDIEKAAFARLASSKVPKVDDAMGVALKYKLATPNGLLSQEGPQLVGLIRQARDVPQFGKKGDLIWIIRFTCADAGPDHELLGVMEEIWVNSGTGVARAILEPIPTNAPDAP